MADFRLQQVIDIWKAMTLSYNLAYLETILVHPNRRQSFANTVQPYWTQDLTPRHTEKSAHDDMFWQKHLIVYIWREQCRCALDLNMLFGWLWLYVSFSISTIYVTFPKSCECERLEANQGIDKVTITKERKILCLAVVNSLSMKFEINSHKYFAQHSFMTGLLINTGCMSTTQQNVLPTNHIFVIRSHYVWQGPIYSS